MTVTFLIGDVLERLAGIPDDSIDCVITSPPYWGLRDYGVAGQLGMEPTLGEHIDAIVAVCREIRRVLKPSGTFWLNYGDCYATKPNGRSAADTKAAGKDDRAFRDKPFSTVGPIYGSAAQGTRKGPYPTDVGRIGGDRGAPAGPVYAKARPSTSTRGSNSKNKQSAPPTEGRVMAGGTLKPKDLCMIPNRVAIALQDDGWWVRAENIWGKPNPMPESVTDRPATAHEKIWMLTKSERYFYDAEAVRQIATTSGIPNAPDKIKSPAGQGYTRRAATGKADKQRGHGRRHDGFNARWDEMSKAEQQQGGRNLRNYEPAPVGVWHIATRPFSEAHFATFPPELVERCIKAGCPAGGTVLDPFGGAGTTGLVADRLNRDAILIELNPDYVEIARSRIYNDAPLLTSVATS